MRLYGAFTAIVTPFSNGRVDEERFRQLIDWQIEQGIHGLIPCGTTGESATLSHAEHKNVIRICIEQVNKRAIVIAGVGSNNTQEAIELTRTAKELGADFALHITPYYNRPTQEGLVQHFTAIAAEVSLPTIAYNVPSRTGVNMLPATLARLRKRMPDLIGVKEATGNLQQVSNVIEECGSDFIVLSGDDFTVLPILAVGGSGVISVVSNIAPANMAGLCNAFAKGDLKEARKQHYFLEPLNRAMFTESNPTPVKAALSMMGKIKDELRLPLIPLSAGPRAELEKTLQVAGLI